MDSRVRGNDGHTIGKPECAKGDMWRRMRGLERRI
jgi:hypothetical protein